MRVCDACKVEDPAGDMVSLAGRSVSMGLGDTFSRILREDANVLDLCSDCLNSLLRKAFEHTHQGPGDSCGKCGLDIRNEIHVRVAAAQEGDICGTCGGQLNEPRSVGNVCMSCQDRRG